MENFIQGQEGQTTVVTPKKRSAQGNVISVSVNKNHPGHFMIMSGVDFAPTSQMLLEVDEIDALCDMLQMVKRGDL